MIRRRQELAAMIATTVAGCAETIDTEGIQGGDPEGDGDPTAYRTTRDIKAEEAVIVVSGAPLVESDHQDISSKVLAEGQVAFSADAFVDGESVIQPGSLDLNGATVLFPGDALDESDFSNLVESLPSRETTPGEEEREPNPWEGLSFPAARGSPATHSSERTCVRSKARRSRGRWTMVFRKQRLHDSWRPVAR